MIEKILNWLGLNEDKYSVEDYVDERFVLNRGILIDYENKDAYFRLNPLRYKIMGIYPNYIVDKITDKFAHRKFEYIRFELTSDNKILDKITNKEYDNLEDILPLLNSQNQFIDDTKDTLDEYYQAANRNARYASEMGDDDEMDMHLFYRKQFKMIKKELFSKK